MQHLTTLLQQVRILLFKQEPVIRSRTETSFCNDDDEKPADRFVILLGLADTVRKSTQCGGESPDRLRQIVLPQITPGNVDMRPVVEGAGVERPRLEAL